MGVSSLLRVLLLLSAVYSLVIGSPYQIVVSHVPTDFSAEINDTGGIE